jgi:hypothetical protein
VSKVYIYVVRYDFGFAPNPFHGVCTFACCMPVIRRTAKVGDWLIGMGGRDLKATGRCIFAMRVTNHLSFNEYWNSEQFRCKRPVRHGSRRAMVGDNIYRTDSRSGKWLQENSVHSQPNGEQDLPNTEHDTETDRVLISEEFFYFGENAPVVPAKLLEGIDYKNGRGHRVYKQEDCQSLLDWIKAKSEQQVNRVLGDPFQFRMSDKRYSRTRNRLI